MVKKDRKKWSRISKFWKRSTEWWFLPVVYLIIIGIFLAEIVIFSIIASFFEISALGSLGVLNPGTILIIIYMFPSGIMALLDLIGIDLTRYVTTFPIIFYAFLTLSIIWIRYQKKKYNKTLKKLIIAIIILMLLSFVGCNVQMAGAGITM